MVLSPTLSMWLNHDRMTDDFITHWSGPTMAMAGLVRVDGTAFRFLGPQPDSTPALEQTHLFVTPTQTVAVMQGGGIQLNLTFSQAAFPDDLSYYSRPYAYITVNVAGLDGKSHAVVVYLDHAADVVVNRQDQQVVWADASAAFNGTTSPHARALRMGGYDQIAFSNRGDGTKNDWGHVYFATDSQRLQTAVQCYVNQARSNFAAGQPLPANDERKPRHANDQWPGSAFVLDFGSVGPSTVASDHFVFAWDDVYTMFYFHEYHVPLWRHLYKDSVGAMLAAAFSDYLDIRARCNAFDLQSLQQLTAAGGQRYATYTALAHRQATGATVAVWNPARQAVWAYMKEISSDGDVSTVDVVYPASPFFVLYGPELLKMTLLPVLAYGQNETDIQYRLPWAPHHLGAWPVSDILGEEQEQMPMEESANLLIMLAAIAQRQQRDVTYLKPYWPALTQWAMYLNVSLPDPGEQLCTDDFEGPSPHNVNLALKGILGLASFSLLLNYSGQVELGAAYWRSAQGFVQQWLSMALDDSGDHYRLQFNLRDTWSTKYNLMWQYALQLDLFPQKVADSEVAWYLQHANRYGVPLDSRSAMVKCDWLSWAAAFASKQQDAEQLLDYIYTFANESPSRSPFSDWYNTYGNTHTTQAHRPRTHTRARTLALARAATRDARASPVRLLLADCVLLVVCCVVLCVVAACRTTNRMIGFTARPVMGGLYARTLIQAVEAAQQTARLAELPMRKHTRTDRHAVLDAARGL